jgi:hypothetical protein
MNKQKHRAVLIAHFKQNLLIATVLLFFCLLIGVLGYRLTDGFAWIDCLHNASMILSGMGPVLTLQSNAAKLFSSFYAIFSGIMFITNIGILLAPAMKHFLKTMHLEED